MRRTVTKALGVCIVLALVLSAATLAYLRRSLPVVDGVVTVAGLSAPLDIVREGSSGIPHVQAATRLDAFVGLGYVHAQDRLWQMEFQRRIAHGRLSEIFGEATLPQDRFLRTLGTGRAAREAWERLPQEAREAIDAYVAGVNAFVSVTRGSRLPPEFTMLGFEPEPWTGPDVVGWVKMMAWDLGMNYSAELLRHDITARLGAERADDLLALVSPDSLTILRSPVVSPPARDSATAGARRWGNGFAGPEPWAASFTEGLSLGSPAVSRLLLGGRLPEALGSNNWVASGHRTASGFPLLANDPHLASRIPSVWYLARLSGGDSFDVMGATLPGAPGVAVGRNRSIAWGVTNVGADVQDFFLERLDAAGRQVEFRGRFEPVRTITEVIDIRGEEPVNLVVRLTRHGPLLSDAINANLAAQDPPAPDRTPLPPLALRWTALDDEDTTVLAFLQLNQARNWSEFTDALRHFVVPSQNFVYADREGHIGYYAAGRLPLRASGDGRDPAEGWSGSMEWTGWVPFEELPNMLDPPGGLIVSANNLPAGEGYPYLIGTDFPDPYRAQRVTDLLNADTRLTADDFAAIQADTHSLHAAALVPQLVERVRPETDLEREALERLRTWTFDAGGSSDTAALFQAWYLELTPALAGDDLGPVLLREYAGRYSYVARFVSSIILTQDAAWCDNVSTPSTESCDETITVAFRAALEKVAERRGGRSGSRWDRMHRAVFPHQGLGGIPFVGWFLNRSVPGTGDWSTVNVGPTAADGSFEQRHVPSYRQIVDLSPADDSRFIDAVGQSGHFLSAHYDDLLADWRAVAYRSMQLKDGDGGGQRLQLRPVVEP
jgi:penicillin amidase